MFDREHSSPVARIGDLTGTKKPRPEALLGRPAQRCWAAFTTCYLFLGLAAAPATPSASSEAALTSSSVPVLEPVQDAMDMGLPTLRESPNGLRTEAVRGWELTHIADMADMASCRSGRDEGDGGFVDYQMTSDGYFT